MKVKEELVADGGAEGEVEVSFVRSGKGDHNASRVEEGDSVDVVVAVVGKVDVESLSSVGDAVGWPNRRVGLGGFEFSEAMHEVVVSCFVT